MFMEARGSPFQMADKNSALADSYRNLHRDALELKGIAVTSRVQSSRAVHHYLPVLVVISYFSLFTFLHWLHNY